MVVTQRKRSFVKTVVFTGVNFCRKVWAFERALAKRILSRKESNMIHRVEFAFGKVDPYVRAKSESAKEISLTELEEL